MKSRWTVGTLMPAVVWCVQAFAALSGADIDALRAEGERSGWTFTVGESEATQYAIDELCGLAVPEGWETAAPFTSFAEPADLPSRFDLRPYCTPVKSQGGCGSCWAFSTVGTLECAIQLRDDVTVDFAEQWLVSCNQETEPPHLLGDGEWGCNGGWFAHGYHQGPPDGKTDRSGGYGPVLESEFPYQASDVPCNCPYNHTTYLIDSWAYVGGEEGIPSRDSIKQAIMKYGPVAAAVDVNSAFQAYTSGVFNAGSTGEVDHGIVLVGWDDSLGTNGVWILRNSWGPGWGMDGYMYIEYGCSQVGFAANYIEYPGVGPGHGPTITTQPLSTYVAVGERCTLSVEASGFGTIEYQWTKDGDPVGTDSSRYAIDAAAFGDGGIYVCYVSDLRGISQSVPARLNVYDPADVPAAGMLELFLLAGVCAGSGVMIVTRLRSRSAGPE